MSRTDNKLNRKLPVTGEVGSEGGSYADPTYQVAESEGDIGRTAQAVEPATTDAQPVDSRKDADEE